MGKDTRAVVRRKSNQRAIAQRAWYVRNAVVLKLKAQLYRQRLRADPVAWAGYLAKARVYKRRKFGWTRVYKPRVRPSGGLYDGLGNVSVQDHLGSARLSGGGKFRD
jgi:hypothetical protein